MLISILVLTLICRSLEKIFQGSLRILQDLLEDLWGSSRGSSWGSLENLWRSLKFLLRSSFSCQDLQGSSKFLSRSSRIFYFLAKILEDLVQIFKDLDKIFEDSLKIFENSLRIFQILVTIDLWGSLFSCKDLQGSFTFLPRSWTILSSIFRDLVENFEDS